MNQNSYSAVKAYDRKLTSLRKLELPKLDFISRYRQAYSSFTKTVKLTVEFKSWHDPKQLKTKAKKNFKTVHFIFINDLRTKRILNRMFVH